MPKLWTNTIEAHRREVRDAILDATASLAAEQGLLSVTMSEIAERAGIGRATLYKYFADVEAILLAWHQREIGRHLEQLAAIRDRTGDPVQTLEAVLEAYAVIAYESGGHRDRELAGFLHRDSHVARAQRELSEMLEELVSKGVAVGRLRNDVAPRELASYCVHALSAARYAPSKRAVSRLVTVTMAGLQTPS